MPLNVDDLYRRYGGMVFRRCRQLLGNEQEAEDAMQETFVNIIRSRDSLDQEFPSSLLYRIATNVSLNRIRTRRRHPEDRNEQFLAGIAGTDETEGRLAADSFLGRLFRGEAESTRVMAVLHFVDGLTLEEVAAECGLSVSGVRKRLRKIKELALELKARENVEMLP